ncbi:MAG: chaperonin GroEL [Thermoplasmata archaeon]
MMPKQIIYDQDAKIKIMNGVNKTANAIKVTLGPMGRYVVLDKSYGSPQVCDDGVTIAKEIELKDPFENMGCKLIKEVAQKTQENVGDGTTTATILAQAMVREGFKNLAAGANPIEIKKGIELAAKAVVEHLKSKSENINTKEKIAAVATISANDEEMGKMIADAMEKVGNDGIITVEESKTLETELKFTEGLQFDKGYVSPYMITDQERKEANLEDPYILIYDKKISAVKEIVRLLEQVANRKKPLLIIADDLEGEALATIILNMIRGVIRVVAVKAPGFGNEQKEILQDIAIMVGGKFISEEKGDKLEDVTLEDLGKAKKVKVEKNKTIIIGGEGDKKAIEERKNIIKSQIKNTESKYDRKDLEKRLARLSGGVAVINIGAATETEMKQKKDKVDDALQATKAAVEEGVVIGGGVALLRAAKALDKLNVSGEQKVGVNIVKKALEEPLRQLALNSGLDGSVILEKVLNQEDERFGFNALSGKIENLHAAGVLDPTKVVRSTIEAAASIAAMLLATEALITDIPEEKEDKKSGGMGGMGDMDY